VKSVFSHLAAADEDIYNDFTEKQAVCFDRISAQIEKETGTNVLKHLLNTHGIINHPQHQHDLVRLGIGMFGEDLTGKIKNKLHNVVTFKTTITQIKEVKRGESIGYGRDTILNENKTIGILPVGYADGYFRALSNRGEVFVNEQKATVIGNVCMDITMIDLTSVQAKVGDKVELFGKNISLSNLAEKANTIPYEILTSISSRVKRVYLSE
jgi:alanine racemase